MKRYLLLALVMVVTSALSAQIVKKDYKLSGFEGINAGGVFEIELQKSSSESVVVEADQEVIEYVSATVNRGVLKLTLESSKMPSRLQKNMKGIKVYISIKELSSLDISGAAKLSSQSTFNPKTLSLEVSGAANIGKLSVKSESIKVTQSGAASLFLEGSSENAVVDITGATKTTMNFEVGELKLNGSGASKLDFNGKIRSGKISFSGAVNSTLKGVGADNLIIDMSGASNISALDFPIKDATLKLTGVSNVSLYVSGTISAEATGGCNIRYKGNPQVKSLDISAASSFKKIN